MTFILCSFMEGLSISKILFCTQLYINIIYYYIPVTIKYLPPAPLSNQTYSIWVFPSVSIISQRYSPSSSSRSVPPPLLRLKATFLGAVVLLDTKYGDDDVLSGVVSPGRNQFALSSLQHSGLLLMHERVPLLIKTIKGRKEWFSMIIFPNTSRTVRREVLPRRQVDAANSQRQ